MQPDNFALKFVVNSLNCLKSIHSLIHSANKVIEYKVCIWHSSSIWGLLGSRYRSRNPTIYAYTSSPSHLTWHLPAPLPAHSPLGVVWMTTYLLYHLKPVTNFFPMCSYIFCNISNIISHRDLHCFVFCVQKLPSMLFQPRKTSHVNLFPFSSQKAGVFFSMISLKGQDCIAPNL